MPLFYAFLYCLSTTNLAFEKDRSHAKVPSSPRLEEFSKKTFQVGGVELRASRRIDSPEQNGIIHSAIGDIFFDGGVGRHRAAELQ
jgi:hypothetical protein